MGKRQIMICDRCKREFEGTASIKFYRIAVGVAETEFSSFTSTFRLSDQIYRDQEWCEECVKEVGIRIPKEDKKLTNEERQKKYPSLEDIIRSIIREELDETAK